MEDQFPGFQTSFHKDECVYRRSLSCRIQRRAPRPLLLPPKPNNNNNSNSNTSSFCSSCSLPSSSGTAETASAVVSSAAFGSFNCQNKDPIPLLSPLVLPSMIQPNAAKSH